MILDDEDVLTIASYFYADNPQAQSITIELHKLEEMHMRSAASHVHLALLFASGKLFSGKRAAS